MEEKEGILAEIIYQNEVNSYTVGIFETEEELCELTGLTEEELWQKGFNLDDWEIGIDRIKTWRV